MKREQNWYTGDPSGEYGVLDHKPEQLEGVEQTAKDLVSKYLENQSARAMERGIASGGLIQEIIDELRSQEVFRSKDKNDPDVQRQCERKIQTFADQKERSPELVRAILEQLDLQLH